MWIFFKNDNNDTRALHWFCLVFMDEFEQISPLVPNNLLDSLTLTFLLWLFNCSDSRLSSDLSIENKVTTLSFTTSILEIYVWLLEKHDFFGNLVNIKPSSSRFSDVQFSWMVLLTRTSYLFHMRFLIFCK